MEEDGCQPPCEAVSWNIRRSKLSLKSTVSLLVRLWVEIVKKLKDVDSALVSLLVRLWVEILNYLEHITEQWVSLLVRLWVEIHIWHGVCRRNRGQPPCEAVSWNMTEYWKAIKEFCQPPCEAVSWNLLELLIDGRCPCQPPCEAVSWNTHVHLIWWVYPCQPPCEAVSWNSRHSWREIHYFVSLLVRLWVEIFFKAKPKKVEKCQPPCEAVSWNVCGSLPWEHVNSQPPCEAVSWNKCVHEKHCW